MMFVKPVSIKTYRSHSPRRAPIRLHLEPLEDRQLLATCHVIRLGDFGAGADLGGGHSRGDLRYCINKANDEPGPDTILIQVNGTINLTGPLSDLASDMEIVGPGSELLTIRRDTGGNYRIFTVTTAANVRITGLTAMNGYLPYGGFGGGIFNQGTLTLVDIHVTQNKADRGCGIENSGSLLLQDSVVSNNVSFIVFQNSYGGGIYNTGSLSVVNSAIVENQTKSKGGPFVSAAGAGVYNAGSAIIQSSTIANNQAQSDGGATGNATSSGGGIFNEGSLILQDCLVTGNILFPGTTKKGGGIFNLGELTIIDSTVSANVANSDSNFVAFGAGVYNIGTLSIYNSTFEHNEAGGGSGFDYGYGGAIFNGGSGVLVVFNSTINVNNAVTSGGAIYTEGPLAVISHSTISGNGEAKGGGIRILGPTYMRNTIVAGNAGQLGPDIYGSITSSDHNLIGNSSGGKGFSDTDILNVDPVLGPLTDNGGPTLTMALLPGSPAIDAGDPNPADPPDWDQRGPGFPRIVNGRIDIGAFEVQVTAVAGIPDHLDLAVIAATSVFAEPSRSQASFGNASREAPLCVVVKEDTDARSTREAELPVSASPSGAWERGEVARRPVVSPVTPPDGVAPSLHVFPTNVIA